MTRHGSRHDSRSPTPTTLGNSCCSDCAPWDGRSLRAGDRRLANRGRGWRSRPARGDQARSHRPGRRADARSLRCSAWSMMRLTWRLRGERAEEQPGRRSRRWTGRLGDQRTSPGAPGRSGRQGNRSAGTGGRSGRLAMSVMPAAEVTLGESSASHPAPPTRTALDQHRPSVSLTRKPLAPVRAAPGRRTRRTRRWSCKMMTLDPRPWSSSAEMQPGRLQAVDPGHPDVASGPRRRVRGGPGRRALLAVGGLADDSAESPARVDEDAGTRRGSGPGRPASSTRITMASGGCTGLQAVEESA